MADDPGTLVSAIITTHNRAELLPRAVDSVRGQTHGNLEILVVDDGSTDETERLMGEYLKRDGRIRYLRLESSHGACFARNHGIEEAKGEFVAGLDDDDEWLPRRVEVLLKHFDGAHAFVCSRDFIIHPDRAEYLHYRPIITLQAMLGKNVAGNQVLTRRERLLAVGGFDRALTSGQDYDLWIRLVERFGSAKMVPEALQRIYRNHSGQRVSASRTKVKGEWSVYQKHKSKMTRSQRRLHLVELKRLKGRPIKTREILRLCDSGYFWRYAKYYWRRKYGSKRPQTP